MQWNGSVTLVKEITKYVDDVEEIKAEKKIKKVPAKIKSVKGTEFYAAKAAGIKSDLVIEIMAANYNGEQIIIDERTNIRYELIRSYLIRNGDRFELTVSAVPIKKGTEP